MYLASLNSLKSCSRIASKTECLFLVLTAAVTQASLQSILHKILTAGPSAFNITSLISQAAQLSTQGIQSRLFTYVKLLSCILYRLIQLKLAEAVSCHIFGHLVWRMSNDFFFQR